MMNGQVIIGSEAMRSTALVADSLALVTRPGRASWTGAGGATGVARSTTGRATLDERGRQVEAGV